MIKRACVVKNFLPIILEDLDNYCWNSNSPFSRVFLEISISCYFVIRIECSYFLVTAARRFTRCFGLEETNYPKN